MLQFIDGINIQHSVLDKPIWKPRIGIHSGPLIARFNSNSFAVWGETVNIAERLESTREEGKVHITEKTANYLGDKGIIIPRGEINL